MQNLFEVHGDHPTLKRADEYKLTEVESNDLMAELAGFGYENLMRYQDTFFEEGDEILITEKMYNDADKFTKETIDYMFTKQFPIKGKVTSERINRFCGDLVIEWENVSEEWGSSNTTNTNWLSNKDHGFGMSFIQPIFDELEIITCPDKYLHEDEMVVKYYALQNKLSEKLAISAIARVQSAMGEKGIVFYRP